MTEKIFKLPNFNKIRVEKTKAEHEYWASLAGPVIIIKAGNKKETNEASIMQ